MRSLSGWVLSLLVFSSAPDSASSQMNGEGLMPTKLPAIGYLGRGYDIIYGNPQPLPSKSFVGPDPGFRAPLFQLDTYYISLKTPDGLYILPDGVAANMCNACSMETVSSTVHGATSYSDTLHAFVELEGGVEGEEDAEKNFSFTASGDFNAVTEKTYEEDKVLTQSRCVCCVYEAHVLTYDHAPLHSHFIEGVRTLPTNRETKAQKDAYWRFIDEFGTHFVSKLLMGGRVGVQTQMDSSTFSDMQTTTINLNVALSGELKGKSLGVGLEGDMEFENSKNLEEMVEEVDMFNYGGQPPMYEEKMEDVLTAWYESASLKPMPLHYDLRLISDMLSDENFPTLHRMRDVKHNLKVTVWEYCERELAKGRLAVSSCHGMMDKPLPANWYYTGVGAPTNMQPLSSFDRVGGECPKSHMANQGFAFERGGCNQDVGWWTRVVDKERCSPSTNPDEGMFLKNLCRDAGTEGGPVWRETGVGSPVEFFTDFTRVGVMCEADEVMTGMMFRRGGCGQTKSWTSKLVDYKSCGVGSDKKDGLVAKARCMKIAGGTKDGFWYSTGVGTPISNNGAMERVGGKCPENQFVMGVRFRNGGCGMRTFWWDRKLNNARCTPDKRVNGGLTMDLFCVTPVVPLAPPPNKPGTAQSVVEDLIKRLPGGAPK